MYNLMWSIYTTVLPQDKQTCDYNILKDSKLQMTVNRPILIISEETYFALNSCSKWVYPLTIQASLQIIYSAITMVIDRNYTRHFPSVW